MISEPATDPAAALVSIDPTTGQVKAYVGGSDFWGAQPWSKVDLADIDCYAAGSGCRQAGSTFKPFVLAAALRLGGAALTDVQRAGVAHDPEPAGQPPWLVNNYDGTGEGRMNLTDATVDSVNTVYAQLVMDVGIQPVVDLAKKMGVRSPLPAVPSTALGSNGATVLDMASAYDTLAGDGVHTDPVFVTRVHDERRHRALPGARRSAPGCSPETTSRTITGVLQQVVTRGTGINARIGRPVAGKTGTSDNWADAWFVGYTPQLVTAVWVGFPPKEIKMRPPTTRITVTGGSWPAQIWQGFEGAALAETPVADFPAMAPSPTTTTTKPSPSLTRPPVLSTVGLSVADATRTLRDAGYRVQLRSVPSREVPPGNVVSQDPPAGRSVKPGVRVTISVSDGPPRSVAVPNVLGDYADQAATTLRAAGFEVSITVKAEPPPGDPAARDGSGCSPPSLVPCPTRAAR